jgi:DNA-binding NtrC family response regulator
MFRILVLEKDQTCRSIISDILASSYDVSFWSYSKDMVKDLKSNNCNGVILDLSKQQKEPFKLLQWIKKTMPYVPVIITSREEKAELAVKAIKQGAFDFIAKPFSGDRIKHAVKQALEERSLKNEIDYLRRQQDIIYNFDQIIAFSPIMRGVIKTLKKFSKTDTTILMTGETGTGKSFLSGTIHFNSRRRSKPFIKINCANIPETLLESELFGHEKGAFTGADKVRVGRFEQAHGGTLFLDEIGEMSLPLQAKMLRVLEERCFERVGGNKTIYADVRVIAATNRNLPKQIAEGQFREDLYYRINVLSVRLPPLREREQCIESLARSLLARVCRTLRKNIVDFSPQIIEWMKNYEWPGNIRQLSNTIERAAILEESSIIQKESVMMMEPIVPKPVQITGNPTEPLHMREREMILAALKDSLWIQKDAAKLLGISPRALNYKINKIGITHPRWRKNKP